MGHSLTHFLTLATIKSNSFGTLTCPRPLTPSIRVSSIDTIRRSSSPCVLSREGAILHHTTTNKKIRVQRRHQSSRAQGNERQGHQASVHTYGATFNLVSHSVSLSLAEDPPVDFVDE